MKRNESAEIAKSAEITESAEIAESAEITENAEITERTEDNREKQERRQMKLCETTTNALKTYVAAIVIKGENIGPNPIRVNPNLLYKKAVIKNGMWALHYKIGIVNKTVVLTKIQLPLTLDEKFPWDRKLYESRGTLLLLGRDSTHFHQLNVYEMRNGHSEWSLKYFVNLDDIMMPISEEWRIKNDVPCIALGEREEDSFMVIGSGVVFGGAKIIQYNFGLKTYRDLSDPKLFFLHGSFLFTASFAGV
ncbi:hypothetical protein Tco_0327179 [Tanacetum coccineum]